jgi:hypothetical protein
MGETAEDLARDIEDTRSSMSGTLEAIGDRVSPARVMERRRNRVVLWFQRAKDSVMGTAENLTGQATDTMHRVGDAPASAVDTVKSTTSGAPLVAGGIAFGVGVLLGSALPPSRAERRLGEQARQAVEPVQSQLQEAGREVVENLREPVTEAVQDVKQSAEDGARQLRETAGDGVEHVKEQAH